MQGKFHTTTNFLKFVNNFEAICNPCDSYLSAYGVSYNFRGPLRNSKEEGAEFTFENLRILEQIFNH